MTTVPASFRGRAALVLAATGTIASAVSLELVRQGARPCLTARDPLRLARLAERIEARTGVRPETAVVDATDRAAVARLLASLEARGIVPDWVLNGIGVDPRLAGVGEPVAAVPPGTFAACVATLVGSQCLTATVAAGPMARRGSGTLVLLGPSTGFVARPGMATLAAAGHALEAVGRVLAAEHGHAGLRVCCVRMPPVAGTPVVRHLIHRARTGGGADASGAVPRGVGRVPLTPSTAARALLAATTPAATAPAAHALDGTI